MLCLILWSVAISLIVNGAMFVVAFRLKSDKLTDASYALSFIALSLFAYGRSSKSVYASIATAMVCLWALRIGSFLLYRVLRSGKDRRFDNIRDNFWQFGKFWLGQAVTVWVLMIPTTLTLSSNRTAAIPLFGIAIWLIGFALESIADLQKYRFTHNSANKGKWIDNGVWRYSRHPNYFGEILVWFGIYIYDFPGLSLEGKIAGAVSPLFIVTLLLFVSGIPILEKSADKKWGDQQAYKTYRRQTSLLVPLPKRK